MIALPLGESAHEMVDGHVKAATFAAWRVLQGVIGNGHGGVGRNDVNVIGFDGHPVGDFLDVHGGFFGKKFGEHAVMLGVEMLDENEGHAGIGSQVADEFGESFDSARGSANSGDQQVALAIRERGRISAGRIEWVVPPRRF